MSIKNMNSLGILSCTRYAFMPNKLNYCGPDKNRDLFEYGVQRIANRGLEEILEEFETLHPYLKFIAISNGIKDIYDPRVIEAYWLGNELLQNVTLPKFYDHLLFGQNLKKRLDKKTLNKVIEKIPLGAKPHHSFHVFHVFKRTGNLEILHTLDSMDNCRISWGKIKKILPDRFTVDYTPLVLRKNKMALGPEKEREILRAFDGKGFVVDAEAGDWISIHWGWACEKISLRQKDNLEKWTKYHLSLFNGI